MSKARLQLGTGLWLVGALIVVAHLILLVRAYSWLPSVIPAFVDLAGHPILGMPKSLFAVLRLPVMGVLLQGVCAVMARNTWQTQSDAGLNRILWAGVSLVAASKALLSTLDLLSAGSGTHALFRGVLLVVSACGVLMLAPCAYRLIKAYADTPGAYLSQIEPGARLALVGLLVGYVGIVLAPLVIGR